jgi:membrane protease YdiL (CAAX protease family)
MNGTPAPRLDPRAPLGFAVLVLLVVTLAQFGAPGYTLAVALAPACVHVLPAGAPWLPLAARATLLRYAGFAVAWLLFVAVYLRACHWAGATVLPQETLREMAVQGAAMPGFWLYVAGIVIAAPVLEELLFRGYLLGIALRLLPAVPAQLLVAAAFGAIHGAPYALPIGVLGLFFGWLRARHGSLLPSMLAHAVHNGLTVLVTVLWPGHLDLLYPK